MRKLNLALCALLLLVLAAPPADAQANDDCVDALPLSCGDVVFGDTSGASSDPAGDLGCGTSDTGAGDLWYTVTGTGSNITVETCGSAYDTKLQVFEGSCGSLTCVGGNDDACGLQSRVVFPSVAGTTYRIKVFGFGSASGAFELSVTCAAPPGPGETRCSAFDIACGDLVVGDTTGKLADVAPFCGTSDGTGGGIWYRWQAPPAPAGPQCITVSTCSPMTDYDTKLRVFSSADDCLSPLTCVAGNDDDFTCGFGGLRSTAYWTSVPGTTYWILVHGFGSSEGVYELSLTCVGTPPNDSPCGAEAVDLEVATPVSTNCASADPGEVTPGAGTGTSSCNSQDGWCSFETDADNSVWYSFVAPASGCVSVLLDASGDSQLAVYDAVDCGDYSTFVELAGNDDGGPGLSAQIDELSCLEPGRTYYVQLDGFNGSAIEGDLTIVACSAPLQVSACDPGPGAVVGLDISAAFNVDVIVNDGSGALDPAQDTIDLGLIPGNTWAFATQSAAELIIPAFDTPAGLPNDGFFPANAFHPDVQLAYDNADDGDNAWRLYEETGSLIIPVPFGSYEAFHYFATTGDGSADLNVTMVYSDGLAAPVATNVPDWFDDPADTADRYRLVDGRDRVRPTAPFDYEDRDDAAIFGLRVGVDPARVLEAVILERTDSSGVVSVFGALAIEVPQAGECCQTRLLGDGDDDTDLNYLAGSFSGGTPPVSGSWTVEHGDADSILYADGPGLRVAVQPDETTLYCFTAVDACGTEVQDCVTVQVLGGDCGSEDGEKKTLICHVPPGNPENAHEICVGSPAIDKHLSNHGGDRLGACDCNATGEPFSEPPPCVDMVLEITFDNFANETSWEVLDETTGIVLASVPTGTYSSTPSGSTQVVFDECVDPTHCYRVTLFDSFGDGICCAFGVGNWNVSFDGVVTPSPSGGNFGSSESVEVGNCMAPAPFETSSSAPGGSPDLSLALGHEAEHGKSWVAELRLDGLTQDLELSVELLDAGGNRVALLHEGSLKPGTHRFGIDLGADLSLVEHTLLVHGEGFERRFGFGKAGLTTLEPGPRSVAGQGEIRLPALSGSALRVDELDLAPKAGEEPANR